jgi:mRNA degradation ribonuclease J1/J2
MMNSEHIIPAHGDREKLAPMIELSNELGYKTGKTVHLMSDGDRIKI